ncbi:MAG: magnesium chelatase [Candidatus Sumerlaeia bacterium]|nr:magnesium chelatase [Candidatus Sumerlaeia bacterium]
MLKPTITTLGELKASGYVSRSVKQELRQNLMKRLKSGEKVFQGIIGYDETVIPQVNAAILSQHDFLLMGLRGQAKTRMIRQLVGLLDEWIPIIEGSPINEDPMIPLTKRSREMLADLGDALPISWVPASERYHEKLATPDVSIADLIGDIDPIKAVARKLDFSDEEVIHYGIIPRTNRGIFAINELPDLQARIQVGLLNILEEKDIQIRGFPVRLPLDVLLVFTANPEDYTNRGNIITPLKDRIDAQILTHYPESLEDSMSITLQEAWTDRDFPVHVPLLVREIIEQIAVEARLSEFVDRNSGVSARMAISYLETVISCAENTALRDGQSSGMVRVSDIFASIPALTGKIELVYKGEQEGVSNVALHLIGRAVRHSFNSRIDENYKRGRDKKVNFHAFQTVIDWFEAGNKLHLSTNMSYKDYVKALKDIDGLEKLARDYGFGETEQELPVMMEFIVEGLHQNFLLTKHLKDARISYSDAVSYMMDEISDDK